MQKNQKEISRPKARSISKTLEFSTSTPAKVSLSSTKKNTKGSLMAGNFQTSSSLTRQDKSSVSGIKLAGRKRLLFYIGAAVILPLLVLGIGFYSFLSFSSLYTATIRYEYKNIVAAKEIEATASSDFKITKLEDTDAVSANQPTTGEKVVGERAKGRITIFNATPEIKIIKKGSAITCVSAACNGLVFTSVNDLNLGPGSSINDYEIIASDIGENYNLAINAGRFKVLNFNSNTEIIASNIEALTGGTPKKIVKVVSAADIKAVEEKALADLRTILLNKIKSSSNNINQYIISDATFVIEKISAQTDPEGTETETVNTSVQAKGTVDGFPKGQIQTVIDEMKVSSIPSGFYLDEKFFNSSTEVVSSSPGKIVLKVSINGIVRPELDLAGLEKNLGGKSMSESEKILSDVPNTKSFTYDYSPSSMPGFLRRVPSDPDRIEIKLIAEAPANN